MPLLKTKKNLESVYYFVRSLSPGEESRGGEKNEAVGGGGAHEFPSLAEDYQGLMVAGGRRVSFLQACGFWNVALTPVDDPTPTHTQAPPTGLCVLVRKKDRK